MPRNPNNTIDRGPKIPRELVRPYIKEYLEKRDMGVIQTKPYELVAGSGTSYSKGTRKFSVSHALQHESGVNVRRIWEILNKDGYTFFDTVDKLFCGMNMPDVWHADPELNKYYTGEKEVVVKKRPGGKMHISIG